MERGNKLLWVLIIGGIAFFAVLKILSVGAEGLWFASEGYGEVFMRILLWRTFLFVIGAAWFFLLIYVPYRLARRIAEKVPMPLRAKLFDDMEKVLVDAALDRWALVACLALAFIAGVIASGRWVQWMHFAYATPFGINDPVFGKDACFYVFRLPLLRFWATFTLVGSLVGIGAMVLRLRYEELLRFEESGMEAPAFAARPLLAMVAVLLLVLAFAQFLGRYDILFSKRGVVYGAGFSDVYGTLPAFWLLISVSVGGAIFCLTAMVPGSLRPLRWVMTALAVAWLGGRLLFPAAMQAFTVAPNEQDRERPFLKHNIQMTRLAYGLEKVTEREHPAHPAPTLTELETHQSILANVRLWDIEQLLDTLSQAQALRGYYGFSSVDYDRYVIGGRLRQVAVATRELFLPSELRRWVNEHLLYTHGYGITVVPVTEFTGEGAPHFFVKDIPPKVADGTPFRLKRPAIYFGEFTLPEERMRRQPFGRGQSQPQPAQQPPNAPATPAGQPPEGQPPSPPPTSPTAAHSQQPAAPTQLVPVADYVLVRTKMKEFDYPLEQGKQAWKTTTYQAEAGVPIGSWWRRLLFAARFMDLNLLLTTAITSESRLLMYRRVLERVNKVAPFLLTDADPYPVINNEGHIVWLVDTYTSTGDFPYSTPNPLAPQINYLRNAVKVTVDAYTGRMTFYGMDDDDPLLQTYRKAFPTLFRPREEMPSDIKAHIRYPRALFYSQALLYCLYHMTNPDHFYIKEDAWEVAKEKSGQINEPRPMLPYYIVMRPPDDDRDRFLLLLPFTPLTKQNMIAWMAVHCDYDRYGQMFVFRFPKDRTVFGPQQVEARIDADPSISRQLSLWNQEGSRVIRGNLLVVPVGNSLVYVEPLYLQSEQTRLPELKRVVAAAAERVVMGNDLWDALSQLFKTPLGDGQGTQAPKLTPDSALSDRKGAVPFSELMALLQALDEAQAAQERGDWQGYGKAIQKAFAERQKLLQRFSQKRR